MGMDSSFIRFYFDPPYGLDKRQLMIKCMMIPIGLLIIGAAVVIIFFHHEFSMLIFGQVSWLITSFIFIHVLSTLILRYLNISYRMEQNIKMYTIQNVLVQFFTKIFLIVAVLFNNNNFEIVMLFNVSGLFILTIVYSFLQRKNTFPKKPDFSLRRAGKLISFGIGIWPVALMNTGNALLTGVIISKSLGYYELGIFTSAAVFVAILGVFHSGFTTYWSAYMYANYMTDQARITKIHNYMLLSCIVTMIGFVVFKDIAFLFMGEKYHASKPIFALILVAPILSIIGETTSYGINISNKTQYHLVASLTSLLTNLAVCIFSLPYLGIAGAALASAVAGIIQFFLRTHFAQRYYTSIENIAKTVTSVFLIVTLSVLNYFYTDSYTVLVTVSLMAIVVSGVIFKKEIQTMHGLLKFSMQKLP